MATEAVWQQLFDRYRPIFILYMIFFDLSIGVVDFEHIFPNNLDYLLL